MARVNPDGTITDDCPIGPRWKDLPAREDTVQRRIRMWFWDLLYHWFTNLSMRCSARYIKAKYGSYPEWWLRRKERYDM